MELVKKIAIIGPSHVAAFMKASQTLAGDYPDTEFYFFTAPGQIFKQLRVSRAKRVFGVLSKNDLTKKKREFVKEINGATKLSLDGFDAIVLYGLSINENINAQILRRFSIDGTNHSKPHRRISMDSYRAMIAEILATALPSRGWRKWAGPPIFATPAPRVAENCVDVDNTDNEIPINVATWVPLVEGNLTEPESFTLYIEALRKKFAAMGITFVPNPDESYGKSGLTKAEYARGAINLRGIRNGGADFDAKHMNAEFGALCVRNLMDVIESHLSSD